MMYRSLVLYGYRRDRLLDGPAPTGFMTGRLLLPLALPFLSIAGGLVLAMFTATLRAHFPGESAARAGRQLYADEQRSRRRCGGAVEEAAARALTGPAQAARA
ncbi:hypothetical protein GXW82_08660 [Streptacidiphilus sp. 4-A2]|nr:hypothetical protein [Streptacidiphilus sp. 4-A2]